MFLRIKEQYFNKKKNYWDKFNPNFTVIDAVKVIYTNLAIPLKTENTEN